jgi:hypothetical protein
MQLSEVVFSSGPKLRHDIDGNMHPQRANSSSTAR